MNQHNKSIAIVGMSCFAPGATDIHQYWENLVNGVDSIVDVPADRIDPRYFEYHKASPDRFYCKRGGFAPEIIFDPVAFSMLPVSIEGMDTAHLLALQLVYKALEDASVFEKNISLKNSSLIIGKGNYVGTAIWRALDIVHVGEQISEILKMAMPGISAEDVDRVKHQYQKLRGRYGADSMIGLIPNLIASLIANKLDMHGPAYTVDAACASSMIALDHAINEINSGRSDIAIAGGIHLEQNATFWSIFNEIGALSRKQKITPFDESADGLLPSEGAGFIVIKDLEKAIADNDRIYCIIKGVGVSSDGHATSPMAPDSEGQKLAVERAWQKSGLDRTKIGYIEAHGTATPIGDKTELKTLDTSFPIKENEREVLIGSVKSNIGHAMPAAGIFGLIKTALSLYNRQIPPTLHCEKPLKEMTDTRFRPVQKLTQWDENKYPLVAGVNSFGFGGINAHVVMEAYGNTRAQTTSVSVKKAPFTDKAIVLSASSKEKLVEALSNNTTIREPGNYRLVLFNPTPDRIEKAIKLIQKDKPWFGRMDIWYTNEPLLTKGGKIAFFYPGFDPSLNTEIESIIDYFKIDLPLTDLDKNALLDQTLKLYRSTEALNIALDKLDIKADLYFGHSLGEWFGMISTGMFTQESVHTLLESLSPDHYNIDGVHFIAVSAGAEEMKPYVDSIKDLYLSNDNCPHQALLCGTTEAIDQLIPLLRKNQYFYQVLSFQSGLHTPLIKDKIYLVDDCFSKLTFEQAKAPMWSCNSLQPYPQEAEEVKALTIKHVLETVRFRELVEKLYSEQNVRMFIQIGSGSMLSFIDDTLADKAYCTISTTANTKTTIEQLRKVLALLYIQGKDVNLDFIGADNIGTQQKTKESGKGLILTRGMKLLKNLPLLNDLSHQYSQKAVPVLEQPSLLHNTNNPLLEALNENIKEMAQIQMDMVKLFQSKITSGNNITSQSSVRTSSQITDAEPKQDKTKDVAINKEGTTFEEQMYVSLKTHPTVIDHSLVKQPAHWHVPEDLNPVIPMTMTFELLAEAAHKQDLSKKILKLGPVSVFQWMNVVKPFEQKINGKWKTNNSISVNIKGFASGEVVLGDEYPKPDSSYENDIDLGENIRPLPTKEKIYQDYMFHGPTYQGIEEVTHITEKGIRAYIKHSGGKGSLLDNLGQVYGLYLQLVLEKNSVTFPVKVMDITFFQDMDDQSGIFECVCLNKSIDDEFTACEITLKREGKLWCVVKGWQNRRFEFDKAIWQMMLNAENSILAKEIAPDIFYFYNAYNKSYSWDFLEKRYLNKEEKEHLKSLPQNKRKEYLISRIALKDALRNYVKTNKDKKTYPIEYSIQHDQYGKPSPFGLDEVKGLEISLAHKGTESVAITSDKPVGIDIELIADRSEEFMKMTFTESEIKMLNNKDQAEWTTRFWVAKEAYGKKLGLGLQGNPKRYEVKEIIDEDTLVIDDCKIKTMKFKNHIIGWTL